MVHFYRLLLLSGGLLLSFISYGQVIAVADNDNTLEDNPVTLLNVTSNDISSLYNRSSYCGSGSCSWHRQEFKALLQMRKAIGV